MVFTDCRLVIFRSNNNVEKTYCPTHSFYLIGFAAKIGKNVFCCKNLSRYFVIINS